MNPKNGVNVLLAYVTLFAVLVGIGCTRPEPKSVDPLLSWNEGASKESILQFVEDITNETSPNYVPPEDRIATFDNDGTLWAEKPTYVQVLFLFQRIREMAKDHPEWKQTQPYKAVLEKDYATLGTLDEHDVLKLALTTHAGMTQREFVKQARSFLDAAKHPRFDALYKQMVYQPMLELLDYLRANDFKVFICSGGGIDFIRAFSAEVYGVPPENVIGSSVEYQFQATEEGSVIRRRPVLTSFNDKAAKPANIQLHIGRRPILAFGNSDGDIQMLQYTDDGEGPSLMLLLHHDDAEQEYDYDSGTERALEVAKVRGWTVVSIKKDFKTVFPFQQQ